MARTAGIATKDFGFAGVETEIGRISSIVWHWSTQREISIAYRRLDKLEVTSPYEITRINFVSSMELKI